MYIFITCLHIRFLELPTQDVPSKGDIQFTNSKVSNEYIFGLWWTQQEFLNCWYRA